MYRREDLTSLPLIYGCRKVLHWDAISRTVYFDFGYPSLTLQNHFMMGFYKMETIKINREATYQQAVRATTHTPLVGYCRTTDDRYPLHETALLPHRDNLSIPRVFACVHPAPYIHHDCELMTAQALG